MIVLEKRKSIQVCNFKTRNPVYRFSFDSPPTTESRAAPASVAPVVDCSSTGTMLVARAAGDCVMGGKSKEDLYIKSF